jgi:hypothetical protein
MRQLDQTLPPHPLGPYMPGQGGHPRRNPEARSCRGGHIAGGYVLEYSPDHPSATSSGFVLQHRLVAECHIGRLLRPDEYVHHHNGDRSDNRWTNLEVMERNAHHAHHCKPLPLTEKRVRELLSTHTTSETARLLHIHPQTLRNRFDHLLTKRRSPGGPFPQHFVGKVRELAHDPAVSTRRACAVLEVSAMTLRRCCRMNEIPWIAAPAGCPSHQKRAVACG